MQHGLQQFDVVEISPLDRIQIFRSLAIAPSTFGEFQ
jgi:hypothetical protein